jgi:signal transduction histidine kinase/CheY-like chemotaxis protein/CHASE3 domain sensor protein
MSMPDLSVGQRIGAGFAAVMLLVAAEIGLALSGLDRIAAIQDRLTSEVEPAVRATDELARSVLVRAAAVRNFVLTRDRSYRDAYERALAGGHGALERLGAVPLDADGRMARELVERAAAAHVRLTERFLADVERRTSPQALATSERDLAAARERLLARVNDLGATMNAREAAARAEVSDARGAVRRALVGFAALVLAALALTAGVTVHGVRGPAHGLVRAARALEAGDFGPALALAPAGAGRPAPRDELREAAGAFARMARGLRDREDRLAADGRVAAAVGSSLDLGAVASAALAEMVGHAGADVGAVYVLEGGRTTLRRVAGVRLGEDADLLPADDGLLGEAMRGGTALVVRDVPPDGPFRLRIGTATIAPRALAACPLAFGGETLGVAVVAAVGDLREGALPFLERSARQLAVGTQNALAHARSEHLAAEVLDANRRLQAKNEELHAQGAEIRAQAHEIEAQAAEIARRNEVLDAARAAAGDRARSLEDLDRRKDEFLATLSHELRNPMAAIANAARVLEGRGRSGGREVQVIARQVHHLGRLVDDLLDLSRITHGRIDLRRSRIDAREAVERAVETVRPRAEAKDVRIRLVLGDAALAVEADPARLEQVVSNLLHNAVKYTPPGGRVDVRGERRGGEIELRVRDTGAGIAPELLPRLFQPFTQGARTDGAEQGLGLGLALVRRLVELHGGAVEARSDGPGRGSVFVVRFPFAGEAAHDEGARVASEPAGGLHLLVVDDNEDVAETMAEMLRMFGHTVEVAVEPEEGLRACLARPPDVALLDIGMPGMDGHALARSIRARLPEGARTRLVAVTGYGQAEDRARSAAAGFDLHLVKPVDPEALRDALEALAGGVQPAA